MKTSGASAILAAILVGATVSSRSISKEEDQLSWNDLQGPLFKLTTGALSTPDLSQSWVAVLRKQSLTIEDHGPKEKSDGSWTTTLESTRKYSLSEVDSSHLWKVVRSTRPDKWESNYVAPPEILGGGYWSSVYIANGRITESSGINSYPSRKGAVSIGSDQGDFVSEIIAEFEKIQKEHDRRPPVGLEEEPR